jgi:hypothetical protein
MMAEANSTNIEVFYEKSNFFRVIHADGIFGGPTPTGGLHVAFYSQRTPLPKKSNLVISSNGTAVETVTETKVGAFREIEVDVVMDLNVAMSYHLWLASQLKLLRKGVGMSDADWSRHLEAINAAAID